MQPCKTGDQLYSDASPNNECSLQIVREENCWLLAVTFG